jgi:HSP20 family protein
MQPRSMIPVGRDRTATDREANPFASLQRQIDRVFDDFSRGFAAWPTWPALTGDRTGLVPSMDVTETDKAFEVMTELPGLDEKDVQINLADHVLTIKGEKRVDEEEKEKHYRLVERSYGAFLRTLELPVGIDADAVTATMTKGVLKVTVPKATEADGKKIDVKAAA